jgi:hypothetical protein
MHLAHPVHLARVEQDALGGRGLTGIDVRHDADIAQLVQRSLSRHLFQNSRNQISLAAFRGRCIPARVARVRRIASFLPEGATLLLLSRSYQR